MSRDFHHGPKVSGPPRRRRNVQPDFETAKIVKPPTKQHRESTLRHAVQRKDMEALEDYDEWDFDA